MCVTFETGFHLFSSHGSLRDSNGASGCFQPPPKHVSRSNGLGFSSGFSSFRPPSKICQQIKGIQRLRLSCQVHINIARRRHMQLFVLKNKYKEEYASKIVSKNNNNNNNKWVSRLIRCKPLSLLFRYWMLWFLLLDGSRGNRTWLGSLGLVISNQPLGVSKFHLTSFYSAFVPATNAHVINKPWNP